MSIYLIRHGETADNKGRVLQTPDSALSKTGQQQAEKLARRLADVKIDLILSSDYLRTQQTAAALNQFHHTEVCYEPLLRERHFGDWRGKSYADVAMDRLNDDVAPPNGEDKAEFFTRVARAWDWIREKHSRQSNSVTLVVSHGLFCRALVQNHLTLNQALQLPANWLNTSLTIIERGPHWTVSKLNCAAHLSDTEVASASNAGAI